MAKSIVGVNFKNNYKSLLWKEIYKNRDIYLFISPFFIIFLAFILFPIVFSIFVSFQDWDGIGKMKFVGLKQYVFLFKDTEFLKSVVNTLIIWVVSTFPMLFFALIIAFILNSKLVKGSTFYKTIYFLPNVTSIVAVAITFTTIFGNNYGVLNYILKLLGFSPIAWLKVPFWLRIAIATLVIWRWTGYNAIIYLAGLQKIPYDLYESTKIDGANPLQIFFKITIPLLNPVILFTLITTTIGGLQIFAEAQVLVEGTNSSIGGVTAEGGGVTIVYYLYRLAFMNNQYSYACAVSWILFILITVVSLINWIIVNRRDQQ